MRIFSIVRLTAGGNISVEKFARKRRVRRQTYLSRRNVNAFAPAVHVRELFILTRRSSNHRPADGSFAYVTKYVYLTYDVFPVRVIWPSVSDVCETRRASSTLALLTDDSRRPPLGQLPLPGRRWSSTRKPQVSVCSSPPPVVIPARSTCRPCPTCEFRISTDDRGYSAFNATGIDGFENPTAMGRPRHDCDFVLHQISYTV